MKLREQLRDILSKKNTADKFRKFVKGRFGLENLEFYLATTAYFECDERVKEHAVDIYETFIHYGGSHVVNIEEDLRDKIFFEMSDQGRQDIHDLLKQCHVEIEMLMALNFVNDFNLSRNRDKKKGKLKRRNSVIMRSGSTKFLSRRTKSDRDSSIPRIRELVLVHHTFGDIFSSDLLLNAFRRYLQRVSRDSFYILYECLIDCSTALPEEISILHMLQMISFPIETEELVNEIISENDREKANMLSETLLEEVISTLNKLFSKFRKEILND
eukprot:TRINITY_DN8033_c0_g1_i1.p1 TRINITY_DN8033_c0_g1~~TRINITY_DN8033_c0_g1_i1.p1  ORF type:complete len:272 (+),score=42.11 TRINITY_DN8033_c0_g1_i1:54-869(+)